jgi:hypothetical protein
MNRDSVEMEVEPEDIPYGAMEGMVMDSVAAVEQSPIDVEQISIETKPIKARLNVSSARERGFNAFR